MRQLQTPRKFRIKLTPKSWVSLLLRLSVKCNFLVVKNKFYISARAVVRVKDSCGVLHSVRVRLYSGSQISAITSSCVSRIGLVKHKCCTKIVGLEQNPVAKIKGWVVCGAISQSNLSLAVSLTATLTPSVDNLLRRFWTVEEPAVPVLPTPSTSFVNKCLWRPPTELHVVVFVLRFRLALMYTGLESLDLWPLNVSII